MSKPKIKIDIISDVNCPWCYVGDTRLKKAISAANGRYDFEISFKPFELDPTLPPEGLDRGEYFTKKFGAQAAPQIAAMNQRLQDAGAEDGLRFNFEEMKTVNNTFNAHRLIWLAGEYGVQEQVAHALFYSYFTEAKNMNEVEVLTQIGVTNGIPAERLNGFFQGEEGKNEVSSLEQWAYSAGITGVPAFIFNDQYLVSGAQPAETFSQVFAQLAPSLEPINLTGDSCDLNGNC